MTASLIDLSASAVPNRVAAPAPGRVLIDLTHCGRHVTGLERIALELFLPAALAPLAVEPVTASGGGRGRMMWRQTVGLPLAAWRDPGAIVLCPGFPPSIPLTLAGGPRVLPYIHDLFLITRHQDLNARARLYMAAPFRFAVERLPRFLVNSEHTRAELQAFCRPDAAIELYRPTVRNVFGLAPEDRAERALEPGALRLVALGTVEPRKNLLAAAAILSALRAGDRPHATLDIVGRPGWGDDAARLREVPGVTLHGYQETARVRELVAGADLLISTSHDEGLGLPLLEAQYAGLPVVAPDRRVFREVLGASGLLVDPSRPDEVAQAVASLVREAGWRRRHLELASANLARWNGLAAADRDRVIALIADLAARAQAAAPAR